MKTITNKLSLALFFVLFCSVTGGSQAIGKTISIISEYGGKKLSVDQDKSFAIEVTVDDASSISSASFTIAYDTDKFTLTGVESSFFDTFTNQNIPTPDDNGLVNFDGIDYESPLLINTIHSGTTIAALRSVNGTEALESILTLHFTSHAVSGDYTISITPTSLHNVSAGFNDEGESIPLLAGYVEGSYHALDPPTVTPLNITVNEPFKDSDADGIDDNWEKSNAPIDGDPTTYLNVFSATSDYDNDGISDYQEYLKQNLIDKNGVQFDPKIANTVDVPDNIPMSPRRILPSINLLLSNKK